MRDINVSFTCCTRATKYNLGSLNYFILFNSFASLTIHKFQRKVIDNKSHSKPQIHAARLKKIKNPNSIIFYFLYHFTLPFHKIHKILSLKSIQWLIEIQSVTTSITLALIVNNIFEWNIAESIATCCLGRSDRRRLWA